MAPEKVPGSVETGDCRYSSTAFKPAAEEVEASGVNVAMLANGTAVEGGEVVIVDDTLGFRVADLITDTKGASRNMATAMIVGDNAVMVRTITPPLIHAEPSFSPVVLR